LRRDLAQIALEWAQPPSLPAGPVSPRRALASDVSMHRLETRLRNLVWVSYSPVEFDPDIGRYPDDASLQADLTALRLGPVGGIITFGSDASLARVPALARAVGLNGVIMGIFDPCNASELSAAISAKEHVDGYCVGHLGLREGRY